MATKVRKFRLHEQEKVCLLVFCDRYGVSQSDALRVLIFDGPIAIAAGEPVSSDYVLFDKKTYAIGGSNKIAVELIRQTTNLSQCSYALDRYYYRNGIGKYSELAPEEFFTLPEDIQDRFIVVSRCINAVSVFVRSLSKDSQRLVKSKPNQIDLSSRSCMVSARIGDSFLQLLALKAATFQLNSSAYIRLMIPKLERIWNAGIIDSNETRKLEGNPTFYYSVFDFDDLYRGFNACGKVLNDVAHYINSDLKDFRTRSYTTHVQRMGILVGKFDVAIEYYRRFLSRYSLPFPETR